MDIGRWCIQLQWPIKITRAQFISIVDSKGDGDYVSLADWEAGRVGKTNKQEVAIVSAPKSRTETWTKFGHLYAGKTEDGYAVCEACGTRENTEGAIKFCIESPAYKAGWDAYDKWLDEESPADDKYGNKLKR